MKPDREDLIKEISKSSIAREPGERRAFIEERCGDDETLKSAVKERVRQYEEARAYFGDLGARLGLGGLGDAKFMVHDGQQIGKYVVEGMIGEGGMGLVYRARDTQLNRPVALKFLAAKYVDDDHANERFLREARAAAALNHPNVVTVYEIIEYNGLPVIVMEYIEGETLRDKLEAGPLETAQVLEFTRQIALGLSRAHKAGIIHRDLKPANIMVTQEGTAKILDFGLAKLREASLLTKEGTTMGTVAYMSPEQARGEETDERTDIWALGVMVYEMLAGERPFRGAYSDAVIYSLLHENPEPVSVYRENLEAKLERLVEKSLTKDLVKRYIDIEAFLHDLRQLQWSQKSGSNEGIKKKTLLTSSRLIISIGVLLVALGGISLWLIDRNQKVRWAREELLPEIEHEVATAQWNKAYALAEQAEKHIPDDPKLGNLLSLISIYVPLSTDPPGIDVYWQPYQVSDTHWDYLGRTPTDSVRLPRGGVRIKMEKNGYQTMQFGSFGSTLSDFELNMQKSYPEEMEWIPPSDGSNIGLPGLETLVEPVDAFLMDRYEVTNKQFKRFVDSGGYQNPEYWKHPFVKDGKLLTWEEAMALFVDKTGRRAPATWEIGDYAEGEDDLPVGGVSWFEAAAYAEFAEKDLPTIFHWSRAAEPYLLSSMVIPLSNFDQEGPSSVGHYKGMSLHGLYDMAGNVREWLWTKSSRDSQPLILGGAWNEPSYVFNDVTSASPWDRSLRNGFRCMRYLTNPDNLADLSRDIEQPIRDFYSETPVTDEVFDIFLRQYAYDNTPLNAVKESVDRTEQDWIKEKISFDAAYANERMQAYLFLPKQGNPPYQTVVVFPGAADIRTRSSETLKMLPYVDFLVRDGRAVIYPIYKGTYERGDGLRTGRQDTTNSYREHVIMWAKDLSRSIDYLETREDIDTSKLAYYGISWGGAAGPIMTAIEERFKVGLFYLAGLRFPDVLPEVNQLNYLPRVKIPVLVLDGKHDSVFPFETSQKPMFDLLGTPPEHKRHVVFDGGHNLPRTEMIKETLAWLDKYLGSP